MLSGTARFCAHRGTGCGSCFSRGVDPAATRAMSSRSRAAAETVHRVTATLLGRYRRRPGLQRRAPDAALFDDSPHLPGQDRPTKSGAPYPRRGLPRLPGGARQLLREHVMSPAAPRPGGENGACWARVQLPAHGVWIKGRPRGVWSPRSAPLLRRVDWPSRTGEARSAVCRSWSRLAVAGGPSVPCHAGRRATGGCHKARRA